MDDDEGMLFFGLGSLHSIREEDNEPSSHLDSLKSVSAAAKAAYAHRPSVRTRQRPFGFHIPKRAK